MEDLSQSTAQSLLQYSPVAVLLVGGNGKVQGFNDAFASLLGEAANTLKGTSLEEGLLDPLLGSDGIVSWIMPDGDERWLAVESRAIGSVAGITARFYRDVTEVQRLRTERDALQNELKQLALKDEQLPGLLSRYGIQVILEPLVSRSRRYDSPLSLVYIGIDTDEDRDKVVARISYLLRDQTRWADLVGCDTRHNFILVLQETNRDAAVQLVDKLVVRISAMSESTDVRIRACFGITDCQKNDDAESILARAEQALTKALQSDDGIAIAGHL